MADNDKITENNVHTDDNNVNIETNPSNDNQPVPETTIDKPVAQEPVPPAANEQGTEPIWNPDASNESILNSTESPVGSSPIQPEFGAYAPQQNTIPMNTVNNDSPGADSNANNDGNNVPPVPFPPVQPQSFQPAWNEPQKPVDQKPITMKTVIASSVITGLITLALGAGAVASGAVSIPSDANISSIDSNKNSGGDSKPLVTSDTADWESVSKKVSSSVVSIQTQLQGGVAAGSGAIIDAKNGYIITNNHVVESAKTIYVTLSNGQIYEASLKGADATTDIAVIQLNKVPDGLTAVSFGDSDKLAVGEPTMAIGNPLGYANSASTGIISALNRPVSVASDSSGDANDNVVTNAIQVDAAVNQGNSGGPLFNASGEVIGITSSIASLSSSSQSAGSIGIGFAIPSNLVKKVSDSIASTGSFQHAQLGVTVKTGQVTADGIMRGGASVESVSSGGAADKSGLKQGDVIVAYNGNSVDSVEALLGYVRAASVGDTAKLTVVRGSNVMSINVKLDKAETKTAASDDNDGFKDHTDDNDDMFERLFGESR